MSGRQSNFSAVRQAAGAWLRRPSVVLALIPLLAFAPRSLFAAEPPRIDSIEWYPNFPNLVTIHLYDVVPNRTYTLQYLDRIGPNAILTNTSTWGTWSNLQTVRFPPDHFVIADTRTNSAQRFYRLRVTTP